MEMNDEVAGRVLGSNGAYSIRTESRVGLGGDLRHPARVACSYERTKPYANYQGDGLGQNSN